MNATRRILKVLSKFSNKSISAGAIGNLKRYSIAAGLSNDNDNLEVKYNDVTDRFPLVWLRDNCTCDTCFQKAAQSRVINWREFDINVKVKSVQASDQDSVEIKWNDDHKSVYTIDWLKSRSFLPENREKYLKDVYFTPTRKLWNKKDFFDIMKLYEYNEVMNNDETFYNWLYDLSTNGVVLIKNAPRNETECRKLTNKVAFIKKTHYGEDFHVVAKEDTNNIAYLSGQLQLHTDLPYYRYNPGVNILHCIHQTKSRGGENLLSDGFYVAEKLRSENKEVFDILSQTEVNWSDLGQEDGIRFYKIYRAPVISLDSRGNVESIRHSIPQRDSHFTVKLDNVIPWYRAQKIFSNELYDNAAEFKTEPGDILAFDNIRLVHGRMGYEDTENVRRLLVGHFIDWDEIFCKMRLLKRDLNK